MQDILLKDVVSEDELRGLVPKETAAQASSLRNDEFDEMLVSDTLWINESNIAYLDRRKIPAKPRLLEGVELEEIRHQRRIKCPALRVGKAIAYVASTHPEVIINAQKQVLSR